jgi:hypothetical protein
LEDDAGTMTWEVLCKARGNPPAAGPRKTKSRRITPAASFIKGQG